MLLVCLQAAKVLAQLKRVVPQWCVDGPDNIWILKPGGKSRGRGIHCFNSLPKLRQQACLRDVLRSCNIVPCPQ
jgi:Tubulin-tyrosine ligase family